jgi:large subunit ribosomal protein L24
MKLKVGDKVKICVGKDKGKEGKIIHTLKNENKVIIEGINMVKKHVKPNNANETGGIVETEAKIDASNVMIIDSKSKKPTRIYHDIDKKNNKKIRVSKSHEKID